MFGKSEIEKAQEMKNRVKPGVTGAGEACETFSETRKAIDLLQHTNPKVRTCAAQTLYYVSNRSETSYKNVRGWEDQLIKHLDDGNEEVTRRILGALWSIGVQEPDRIRDYLPAFASKLEAPSEKVQYQAVLAMQVIAYTHPQYVEKHREKLGRIADRGNSASAAAELAIEIINASTVKKCPKCGSLTFDSEEQYCSKSGKYSSGCGVAYEVIRTESTGGSSSSNTEIWSNDPASDTEIYRKE
ncbi:HEAT repeat domain-containing protein [Haloferax gibbonsii]|uniref:HEAT repeat domain-containing protein n=1 Tax=Haloferax gibbonsii TaxID=35746 RepID=UPI001267E222|nr:hypothetical protein [Haloferax gibbonsii]